MDPATESRSDKSPGIGERVDADPPAQATRACSNNSNSNSNSNSRLLNLPAELRLYIWRLCCTWPNKPFIRWAADLGGTEISVEVDGAFLFTCKQINEEALPVLAANVQLHITYLGHTPAQPTMMPPRSLCGRIECLFFHCPDGRSTFDADRPPRQSVPFRRFPRLKTFTVCKPILVKIGRLRMEDADGGPSSPMSRERYDALSEEEKLAAWKTAGLVSAGALIDLVARFGRGGWLSQILDPNNHARTYDTKAPIANDSDDDSDEEEQYYSTDEEEGGGSRERERKLGGLADRDLEVISNMHTILEADLVLHEHPDWQPIHVHTLLVTVDTRTRQTLEARFLSKEEKDMRYDRAREAT